MLLDFHCPERVRERQHNKTTDNYLFHKVLAKYIITKEIQWSEEKIAKAVAQRIYVE